MAETPSVNPGYDILFEQTLAEISKAEQAGFRSDSENTLEEMTDRLCLIEQALP